MSENLIRERILIVDDEVDMAEGLKRMLAYELNETESPRRGRGKLSISSPGSLSTWFCSISECRK
jgi:hypothetical protein